MNFAKFTQIVNDVIGTSISTIFGRVILPIFGKILPNPTNTLVGYYSVKLSRKTYAKI